MYFPRRAEPSEQTFLQEEILRLRQEAQLESEERQQRRNEEESTETTQDQTKNPTRKALVISPQLWRAPQPTPDPKGKTRSFFRPPNDKELQSQHAGYTLRFLKDPKKTREEQATVNERSKKRKEVTLKPLEPPLLGETPPLTVDLQTNTEENLPNPTAPLPPEVHEDRKGKEEGKLSAREDALDEDLEVALSSQEHADFQARINQIITQHQLIPTSIEDMDLSEDEDNTIYRVSNEEMSEEEDENPTTHSTFEDREEQEIGNPRFLGPCRLPKQTVERILHACGHRQKQGDPEAPNLPVSTVASVVDRTLKVTQHRPSLLAQVHINGKKVVVNIDTGATRSIISQNVFKMLPEPKEDSNDLCTLRDYQGNEIKQITPPKRLLVQAGGLQKELTFCIGQNDTIVGLDFMAAFGITIKTQGQKFHVSVNPEDIEDPKSLEEDEDQEHRT